MSILRINVKTVKNQHKKRRPLHKHAHRYVKLAVVPHKANDFQPHLIRRYGLIAVLVVALGVQLVSYANISGSVLGEEVDISTAALLKGTNEARRTQNLQELTLSRQLSDAAQLKASDMLEKQYWAHDAPDGTQPWKWFSDVGYSYSEAGENLAKNFYTAEATTTAWLNSAGHRDNIINPGYTDVGFAVASGELEGKPTTIVVALYGRPASAGDELPVAAVAGARSQPLGIVARLGVSVQSMPPAALGTMVLLGFVTKIAFITQFYRHNMPRVVNRPWYQHHHGAVKAGGMFSLMLIMLALYSGGQV